MSEREDNEDAELLDVRSDASGDSHSVADGRSSNAPAWPCSAACSTGPNVDESTPGGSSDCTRDTNARPASDGDVDVDEEDGGESAEGAGVRAVGGVDGALSWLLRRSWLRRSRARRLQSSSSYRCTSHQSVQCGWHWDCALVLAATARVHGGRERSVTAHHAARLMARVAAPQTRRGRGGGNRGPARRGRRGRLAPVVGHPRQHSLTAHERTQGAPRKDVRTRGGRTVDAAVNGCGSAAARWR